MPVQLINARATRSHILSSLPILRPALTHKLTRVSNSLLEAIDHYLLLHIARDIARLDPENNRLHVEAVPVSGAEPWLIVRAYVLAHAERYQATATPNYLTALNSFAHSWIRARLLAHPSCGRTIR